MSPISNLAIFLTTITFGVGLEMIFSKILTKHRIVHFMLSRYIFLLSVPIITVLIMSYLVNIKLLYFFLIFSIIGTLIEYCIGLSYKTIVGQKLWTYHKYSVQGYTSLLSIPIWGLCGVLMYFLSVIFN